MLAISMQGVSESMLSALYVGRIIIYLLNLRPSWQILITSLRCRLKLP